MLLRACCGQLGTGDTNSRGDGPNEMGDNLAPIDLGTDCVPVAIAAGFYHNCALLTDHTVKCWGGMDVYLWRFLRPPMQQC